MPDSFDPYFQWLGILPNEQPANWYRLLGLKIWEANPTAIEEAAQKQSAIARQHLQGPHALLAQQVLTQIATAKLCLLSASKKISYDQTLREQIQGIPKPPPKPPQASPPLPPAAPPPVPTAVPLARPLAPGQVATAVPLARAIVQPPPPPPSVPILEGPAKGNQPPTPLDATVMLPSALSSEQEVDDFEPTGNESFGNAGRWRTSQDLRAGLPGQSPPIVPIPMQPMASGHYPVPGMPASPPVAEEGADEEEIGPRPRLGLKLLGLVAIPLFLLGMLGLSVTMYYLLRPAPRNTEVAEATPVANNNSSEESTEPTTSEESDPVMPGSEKNPGGPNSGDAMEEEESTEGRFVPGGPAPNILGLNNSAASEEIPDAVDMVMKNGKKRFYSPDYYQQDCRSGIYRIEQCLQRGQIAKAEGYVFRTKELFEAYPSYKTDEVAGELDDFQEIVAVLKDFWDAAGEAAYRKVLVGDSVMLGKESFRLVSRQGDELEVEHSGLTAKGMLNELPPLVIMAFYSEMAKAKGSEANLAIAAFGSFHPGIKQDAAASQFVRRSYQQVRRAGGKNLLIEQRLGIRSRRNMPDEPAETPE